MFGEFRVQSVLAGLSSLGLIGGFRVPGVGGGGASTTA